MVRMNRTSVISGKTREIVRTHRAGVALATAREHRNWVKTLWTTRQVLSAPRDARPVVSRTAVLIPVPRSHTDSRTGALAERVSSVPAGRCA